MENLEALSDQELRVRLQQYGFANLPVTDTTRKVLVKKLRLAIEGQASKNRRETVAVAKFSSDEEPEKEESTKRPKASSRRATVGVEKVKSSNGSQSNGNLAETSSKSSRRTSRATPSKEVTKTVSAPLYPSLQEDSDDDVVEVPVTRRSRTPSMGKSETVRTSYKTTVEIPESHIEETLVVEDEGFEVPAPRNPSPKTTVRRKTITTSTSGYSSQTPDRAASSTFGRTSMSTSFNPRGNFSLNQKKEEVEQIELDETNAPYLSNFAKRLSTLRAEPLNAGMDKYKGISESGTAPAEFKTSYNPVSYGYKTSAPAPRQAMHKSGFLKNIGRMYDSLDRQYNFRTILYVIFIIMIIVAVFVIFM